MKLEVGKHYRTAKDRKARIYATDGSSDACVHGAVLYENGWVVKSWFANGRRNPVMATFDDIVGKWKESEPPKYRPYHRLDIRKLMGEVVVDKEYEVMRLIGSIDDENNLVGLHGLNDCITFQQLLDCYTWVDGSPCGVRITTGSCVGAAMGDGVVDNAEVLQDYDWGIMGRPFVKPDVP